jgi:hypothetical protein
MVRRLAADNLPVPALEPEVKRKRAFSTSSQSLNWRANEEGEKVDNEDSSALMLELVLKEGLDPSNIANTTLVDLKVRPETTLQDIHDRVVACLDVDSRGGLVYCPRGSATSLSLDVTMVNLFAEHHELLGEADSCSKLAIECSYRHALMHPHPPNDLRGATTTTTTTTTTTSRRKRKHVGYAIEVICVSRIGLGGPGLRKFKVVVNAKDRVNDMMSEVSEHIGRQGLKFKCGRAVLKLDRTFEDLGVEHGDEIVVTGGRR